MARQSDPKVIREPGVTISGLGITVQADIGGVAFALERAVDSTMDEQELNTELDFMVRLVMRQKARKDLGEKVLALQIAKSQIKSMGDERIRRKASFEIALEGRRSGRLTDQQKQSLDNIDQSIANMTADIPVIEKQIERLRLVIAGKELADNEDEPARLADAAE